MKQRLENIDNAKAILIIMVVLAHVLSYANPQYNILPYTLIQTFITSFHMPAFFLISGILFDNDVWRKRSWGEFLCRRVKTLLIPYLFFESIAIIYLHFALNRITLSDGLYRMVTFRCNVGADWFLPAMFLASTFYYLSVRIPQKYLWPVLAVCSFFCTWLLPDGHWWKTLCRGLLGFGFLFLGNRNKKWLTAYRLPSAGLAFLLTGAFSALSLKFFSNDFYTCKVENPLLFVASGLTGLYFVLSVSYLIHWKHLRVIGENTLPIMGTHQLVLYSVSSSSSVLWVLGMLVLVATVEFASIFVMNRACPFLIGKGRRLH